MRGGRELFARARRAAQRRAERAKLRALQVLVRLLHTLAVQRVERETTVQWPGFRWRMRTNTESGFVERVKSRLRRARRAGETVRSDGTLDEATVRRLYRSADRCAYCYRPFDGRQRTLDHVVPLSSGGAHSLRNVVVACLSCNDAKGRRPVEEFLEHDAARLAALHHTIGSSS